MYYNFKPQAYLVEGHLRAGIYDLKKGHLYSIDKLARKTIKKVINNKNIYSSLSSEEKCVIDTLVKAGIMRIYKIKKKVSDILDLKQSYHMDFCWIEVTQKCNLKCKFCYESSGPELSGKMSFADFKIIVNNLKEIGTKKIQFIGGEPLLLGKTLKEMIRYSRPYFEYIEVYSNGVFINKEWAKFFKKWDVKVALSLHSYISEEHDNVTTVSGSHQLTEKAISILQELDIPVRIAAIKTVDCDTGEKNDNINYEISTDTVRLTGKGCFNQYNLEMFKDKAITKESQRAPLYKTSIINNISGHQCFINKLYISTDMEIYPCVMERRFTHGNLKNIRLKEILESRWELKQ